MPANVFFGYGIQLLRRYAWHGFFIEDSQHFGHYAAGLSHQFYFPGRLQADQSCLKLRQASGQSLA